MRLILGAHPGVHVYDEVKSYGLLHQLATEGTLPSEAGVERTGFKIPRYAEQLLDTTVKDYGVLDTEHKPVPEHPNFFRPDMKVVFMVRNAQDTIVSMLTWKMPDGRSWLEAWGVPIMLHKASRDAAFYSWLIRCLAAANTAVAPTRSVAPVAAASGYWQYKNQALLRYVAEGLSVLAVQYETLVTHATDEICRVCDFLGLEPHKDMLRHHQKAATEVIGTEETAAFGIPEGSQPGFTPSGDDPTRPIDASRMGRWSHAGFTQEELHTMRCITGNLQNQLYRSASEEIRELIDYQI
jgi:hypothetical protein